MHLISRNEPAGKAPAGFFKPGLKIVCSNAAIGGLAAVIALTLAGCSRSDNLRPQSEALTANRDASPPQQAPSTSEKTDSDDSTVAAFLQRLGGKITWTNNRITQVDFRESGSNDHAVDILKGLDRLTVVRLKGSELTDRSAEQLGRMESLKAIGLDDSSITDAGIAAWRLPRLVEFSAVRSAISDAGLETLSRLTTLRKLRLRGTPITDQGIRHLDRLIDLRALDVSETLVGGEGLQAIANLPHLNDLNLYNTPIDDDDLRRLTSATQLIRLNLDKTRVTDQGLANLVGMRQLEWLHLGSNDLTDACVPHLSRVNSLKTLIITRCPKLTDDGREALRSALQKSRIEF